MFTIKKRKNEIQSPIIVLSPGRSGSTLIQRIINTSNNITLWGEHDGFLAAIANSFHNVLYYPPLNDFYYSKLDEISPSLIEESFIEYDKNINWLNPFDKETIRNQYRSFIYSIFNQTNYNDNKKWGFKEIRYTNKDKTVKMLFELFPETKIILSIRNPLDVILSQMLAFCSEKERESAFVSNEYEPLQFQIQEYALRLNRILASYYQWLHEFPNNTIIIRYENLIKEKVTTINRLFNFLDEEVPVNAFEPFKFVLDNTCDYSFHNEMKSLIIEEIPTIKEIFGNYPDELSYPLEFE
jgi:hypothetical protein